MGCDWDVCDFCGQAYNWSVSDDVISTDYGTSCGCLDDSDYEMIGEKVYITRACIARLIADKEAEIEELKSMLLQRPSTQT